jgi:hypothetical protein
MTDDLRCPECGARNTAGADWCTQCYTPLGTSPDPAPDPDPSAVTGGATVGAAAPADDSRPAASGTLRSGDGRFRQTEEGLEWACGLCQEWNPIERVTCSVCGTPFGQSPLDEEPVVRPDVPDGLLVVGSLVLPGLGHWLLGLRGAAVLRALLGLVWGLGGVSLLLQARDSGQPLLPAIPLLLGWAVVAAGSANDAVVEGGGQGRIVLTGRMLLWLTLAVVGGTFAAVLVGVLSAVGG